MDEQTQDEIVALQWQLKQASHLDATHFINVIDSLHQTRYIWYLSNDLLLALNQMTTTKLFLFDESHIIGVRP